MSLSISTRYGSRANDPTLDYPTGSFKNKTAPDAPDGTPLEKDWANDLLGARDAILAEAGILANGVADTAQASQVLAALQTLGLRAATETEAGVLEIATAAEAQALVNDTNALTPAKLASVTATETRAGLIEIATTAEAQALASDTHALTPAKLASVTATETRAGLVEIATTAEAQAFAAGKAIDGAKLAAAFGGANQGLTTNGYQKLPGGLIIQWGTATVAAGANGAGSVTFPLAFPSSCVSLSFSCLNPVGSQTVVEGYVFTTGLTNTGATFINKYIGDGNGTLTATTIYWIAIGY